jgi:prepilin signal peptidase PulO-like enzyme (type II secretory pathway)
LFLKGQCRYCHKKISIQYPLVEIATGLIFLLIFLATPYLSKLDNIINVIFLFYIASVLIIIFVYDVKHYIILDRVLFPAIAITFFYQLIFNPAISLASFVLAVFVASGFFLLIFLISKGTWMGFGDVKLAMLLGLLLGFPNILLGLFLAFFFGAVVGSALMFFGKKGLKSEVPFAPFLIMGTAITMLFGNQIISWYLHFLII